MPFRTSFSVRLGACLVGAAVCLVAAGLICPEAAGHFQSRGPKAKLNAPAPELEGGTEWLNTAGPLRLRDLKGKIVLLDFWTYCCINCMHILPDLEKLEKKYPNELVVIGVHSAKFNAEKDSKNIREAILRYHIKHPVINDANHRLWDAYAVNSWPTFRLIDPEGKLVLGRSGEGLLDELDETIRDLIAKHKGKGTLNTKPLQFDTLKLAERKEKPIYYPGKILADGEGKRLFIADSSHHRIVITDLEGKKLDIAGTGEFGKKDGSFDEAQFDDPQGMALKGETLYVADRRNCLIRKLNLKERTVETFAGTGVQQWSPRQSMVNVNRAILNSPWDLWLAGDTLYAAMAGNHQIWRIDLGAKLAGPYAGTGEENIADGSLSAAKFSQPSGLASDGSVLFVADSEVSAVRTVSLNGNSVKTLVGTGLFNFGDKDGVGTAARLQHALAVGYHKGKVYVADTYNNKIKVIDLKTKECKTWLGDGKPGATDSPPRFDEPAGMSIVGDTLYLADTNNHAIRVIDIPSKKLATLALKDVPLPKPPETASANRPKFPNPTIRKLSEQPISTSGDLTLELKVVLGEKTKLNKEVPFAYLIEANVPGKNEPFEESGSIAKPGDTMTLTLPAQKIAGAKSIKVSLLLYACQTGAEGLCFPKTQVWDVALAPSPAGPKTLKLETNEIKSGGF